MTKDILLYSLDELRNRNARLEKLIKRLEGQVRNGRAQRASWKERLANETAKRMSAEKRRDAVFNLKLATFANRVPGPSQTGPTISGKRALMRKLGTRLGLEMQVEAVSAACLCRCSQRVYIVTLCTTKAARRASIA